MWLGAAVLFLLFHRLDWQIALASAVTAAALAFVLRYRLLSLGPLERWYDDFQYNRRMARMRSLARQEQIEADPINQAILHLQQFASPGLMLLLTPDEFFDLVVRYFRLLGYARRHQRISMGQATDAILRLGEDLYVLRSIHLATEPVGEAAVRTLATVVERNHCARGILVTNLGFSANAEHAAEELNTILVDGARLAAGIMAFQLRDPMTQPPPGQGLRTHR